MEILNVTIGEGRVTWTGRDNESTIDFILVNENARRCVKNMWVDDDQTDRCYELS